MDETRQALSDCLGEFPETPDPDVERVSAERADGFERHLIEFAVEPDERIRAYLLVPDEVTAGDSTAEVDPATDRPGVLAIHSHGGEFERGKSDPGGVTDRPGADYGAALAQRGYVVLCPDLLPFEDRRPADSDLPGRPSTGDDHERFAAMDALLRGSTLQAKYLSDLSVALDVLAGHPLVDPDALGAIGHSLGGQETLWLAWYEDRLTAAVAASGVARLADIQREQILHNDALYVPGLLAVGDMDAVSAGAAPTALYVSTGTDDSIFPVESVEAVIDATADAYDAAGIPERFASRVFDGGHEFPEAVRTEGYDWLDRWLGGE